MQSISSKENRIVKEAASLLEKKYRDELCEYIVEGPNIVKEAMQEGNRVRFIFTRAGFESKEIEDIVSEAESKDLAVYELFGDAFAKVTQTNNPQAISAVIEKRQISEEEFFQKLGKKNVAILDRLQDPGNVGTLLRTAEAMGFGGIIVMKGNADVYQPKVVRSAAGSLLRMPILFEENAGKVADLLKSAGFRLYAAAMDAETKVFDADLRENAAIVIGNEGNGICQIFMERAETISVPMEGKTESINAAVCAAMIMYESLRQRR